MFFLRSLSLSLIVVLVSCQSPEEKAKAMLAKMSIDEKILMLHGAKGGYTGNTPENKNLKIPPLNLNDGPQGFRTGGTTCWPSDLTLGGTWDLELAKKFGVAIGKEFYDKGSNVMLGPGMNVARVPRNGRNFEYISGEDPFLGYHMVQPVIRGIQSQNVIANAKHYINNNQENNRGNVNEIVDERTRHEIYLPPFEGAVNADLGSIMCSYNRINAVHACENNVTLNTDLKGHLGFKGWVMSDWGGTHSTSILQGLDQEMPGGGHMGDALKDSKYKDAVDESVLRILTPMYKFGIFDHYHQWVNTSAHGADVTSKEHSLIARQISAANAAILKNNGVLPFTKKVKSVALIGKDAMNPTVHGGGSGSVGPTYVISPFKGIAERFGNSSKFNCTFDPDVDYYVTPSSSHTASSPQDCCSSCYTSGLCNYFTFIPPKTCWFHPSMGQRKAHKGYTSGSCSATSDNVTYADGSDQKKAVAVAKAADVAIVFMSTSSSEGGDRANLDFPSAQVAVAKAVIAAQPNTIVICFHPGAVILDFANDAAALITMFMPGLEVGHAIADVVFGDVNPSGRLPLTMPNKNNEVGFTPAEYPGVNGAANYTETLFVGYRWYDHHAVTPLYPFGHGLSYTQFTYSNLKCSKTQVSFDVTNSGQSSGAEVPQLYLGFPKSAGEPPVQLKGFTKTKILNAGEKVSITFPLTDRDFSIWDVKIHNWSVVSGSFAVNVGASSRDFRIKGTIDV